MQARQNGRRQKERTALQAAVCHPTRVRAFAILAERPASPAEIARELHGQVTTINYHVGVLCEAGLVEEIDQRPVRGTIEHIYKAIELPAVGDDEEAAMDPDCRRTFAETVLAMYVSNCQRSLESGTFLARTDNHLTRVALDLDETGWEEATAAYMVLFEQMNAILADASMRIAEADKAPVRAISFLSLFQIPRTAK